MEPSTLIEGHIETLSPDGVVHGWLRDSTAASPCHVQVLHEGRIAAEALAREFRPDLLRSGHGHGHYGFHARLRFTLPEGRCGVALHLPRTGLSAPMALAVPALAAAAPASVESLLRSPAGWTVADLLAQPDCLKLDLSHTAQGTPRFVDSLFRFALNRWPSPAEARLHAGNLQAGRLSPRDLLVDLLTSRERADMKPSLPSPYDPDFPFPAAS